jgi:hypothetical protein
MPLSFFHLFATWDQWRGKSYVRKLVGKKWFKDGERDADV